MKKLVCVMLLLGGTALAQEKAKPVAMAPADMKWEPVPNTKVQIANITGDWKKGAHTVVVKMPAGDDHPLHSHTATLKTVIIEGTWLFGAEGEKPKTYGPGSVLVVPGGMKHTSACDKTAACMLYQEGDGAFDMKPAGAPPKAAAKK